MDRYGDLVYVADGREEFLDAVKRALESSSPDAAAERAAAVENESWTAKVERISEIVAGHIRPEWKRGNG